MLNRFKEMFTPNELLKGNYGIEREALRVSKDGRISYEIHPKVFGRKIENPYITTDFAESQVEVITPTFTNIEETYNFLNALYDIVSMEIGDEYLWPQSMPSIMPGENKIPVANFGEGEKNNRAHEYREYLLKKYGGKKQLISGIHFNFSFSEEFIEKLYKDGNMEIDYKGFKDNIYLKVARNFLRYRWLLIYFTGATSVVHKSYLCECKNDLEEISKDSFSCEGSLSYRNSEWGYKNTTNLFPNYDSVVEHLESIDEFIRDGVIESHKELYSQIRLKPKNKDDLKNSLINDGILYLEYRNIDINPFEKSGVSLDDLYFLQVFNLFLLLKEEKTQDGWQEEAQANQYLIASSGSGEIMLKRNGESISKEKWALELLDEMMITNKELNLKKEDVINKMVNRVKDPKLSYAYKVKEMSREDGYINSHIDLAKKFKQSSYENRFKLEGYEDLELSTQILMKESIKRGIAVEVVDRSDNFILLKKDGKVEYVKQATKTSKDNYITVLIMENKVVTKKVLKSNGIRVPEGEEFSSIKEALLAADRFKNTSLVIKPKSTNFGLGISIFKDGASKDDIIKAFEIAFKHDNTVLIEEFIKGKEYRFLVFDDRVVGILHRVPANVMGNGISSIKQLVEIKNEDPLRGYHYRTPLEKINLDENAELFLKHQNKDFNYIPGKDEVVYLRENSNISTGGDSIDYTDKIPDKFKEIAVKSAKAAGARICGVDMMLENYSDEGSKYGIIEINFNPAIHIHSYPYKGKERNIAAELLKVLDL
ncbi:bifunctional glutamate--cysteine ligase GshA/glutathione synthetase GshB [Clostridium vincentii]|uniref:Glutathione biosynthesis bifunctional protein GshAB n=1 Tax=Clostridium vincentii TaxID=52704 RepID=A0A2T0BBS3_9CLOT|nr:bifunctional glutamate--cysteine ligase GshA/glutathione synthetase GshB [Clostridium vincentii]PRR81351.1 Glutathione biosynthesis bifunctional protein GshAB [Clostridium vincentii]